MLGRASTNGASVLVEADMAVVDTAVSPGVRVLEEGVAEVAMRAAAEDAAGMAAPSAGTTADVAGVAVAVVVAEEGRTVAARAAATRRSLMN